MSRDKTRSPIPMCAGPPPEGPKKAPSVALGARKISSSRVLVEGPYFDVEQVVIAASLRSGRLYESELQMKLLSRVYVGNHRAGVGNEGTSGLQRSRNEGTSGGPRPSARKKTRTAGPLARVETIRKVSDTGREGTSAAGKMERGSVIDMNVPRTSGVFTDEFLVIALGCTLPNIAVRVNLEQAEPTILQEKARPVRVVLATRARQKP